MRIWLQDTYSRVAVPALAVVRSEGRNAVPKRGPAPVTSGMVTLVAPGG